jgi:hypothetical protein
MKLFSRLMRQTNLLTKQLPDSSELPQPTFEALLPKTPELRNQFIELDFGHFLRNQIAGK